MNGKTILALIGGIAAGAALATYLSSEKGSKIRENLNEMLGDLGAEFNSLLADSKDRVSEIADDFKAGGEELKKHVKPGQNGTTQVDRS